MASFRESLSYWLPNPRRAREQEERLREMQRIHDELPERINRVMREQWDDYWQDYMVRQSQKVLLTGRQQGGEPEEAQRLASVNQCRHQFFYDPLFARIINLWTDFGFRLSLSVVASDPKAQEVWDEYLTARRNVKILGGQRRHTLSNRFLTDGELFWTWFVDEHTGLVTTRLMYTDEVDEIIAPPGDPWVALYYQRNWVPEGKGTTQTWWYQDKDATEDDLKDIEKPHNVHLASDEVDGVDVYASQFDYPGLGRRGWPLMAAGADWSQAYKSFSEDRVAITRAAATFYRKITVRDGGSRDIEALRSKLDSALSGYSSFMDRNPPPAAGSTMVTNDLVSAETMPLHTGAGDADRDGAMLIAMAGIAAGVFPHFLGRGEAFRLATATALETPMLRMWQRYSSIWEAEWVEHFQFVLDMRERYAKETYEDREVTVTTDPILKPDVAAMSQAITAYYAAGLLPKDVAMRLSMESLEVTNISDIMAAEFPEGQSEEELHEKLLALRGLFQEARGNGDEQASRAADVGLEMIDGILHGRAKDVLDLETMSPGEQRAVLEAAARIVARG